MSQSLPQHEKCPPSFWSSDYIFDELVDHEEILSCEMQAAVAFVAPTLIKVIFQFDDGQILIYQKLHAIQDRM